MEFILGALSTAAFLFCLYAAYKYGQRSRKSVPREMDEQQVQRAKRLREGFEQMMSYNESKALERKKVM